MLAADTLAFEELGSSEVAPPSIHSPTFAEIAPYASLLAITSYGTGVAIAEYAAAAAVADYQADATITSYSSEAAISQTSP